MNFVVVIPAYNPDSNLLKLVEEIIKKPPSLKIIVVDDGSADECQKIFLALNQFENVILLKHAHNLGKGAALKTAFHYFLTTFDHHALGVITADADGQHSFLDIMRVSECLKKFPSRLCLGVRSFDRHKIPWRSFIGNVFSRFIFWCSTRYRVSDIQTGLRGIPRDFLEEIINLPEGGYDFEMHMLMYAAKKKVKIKQIPIETIYINQNRGSHFNPFWDSLKILYVFLRFVFSSLVASLLDFIVFAFSVMLTQNILFSMILGRIFGGTLNFFLGKRLTFKSHSNVTGEIIKFIALVIFLMFASYGLVIGLKLIGVNVYLGKIISEVILFVLSFLVQRFFVFKKNATGETGSILTDWEQYHQTSQSTPAELWNTLTD